MRDALLLVALTRAFPPSRPWLFSLSLYLALLCLYFSVHPARIYTLIREPMEPIRKVRHAHERFHAMIAPRDILQSFFSFCLSYWKCEHADRKYAFLVVSDDPAALPSKRRLVQNIRIFSSRTVAGFRRHRSKLPNCTKFTVVEKRGGRIVTARFTRNDRRERYPRARETRSKTRNMKFADRSRAGDDKYKAGVVKISRTMKSERQGVKAADGGGTKRVNSKFRTFRRILNCNGTP